MSNYNLLIFGGAVGLLCAGSPAALAQSVPLGGSKINMGEVKPPFKIPNGGNFRYNGKSSQGDFLLMEVKWQAAGAHPDGAIRISGDVKYKNPKTNMMDVRTIDGKKSYITKNGELFFALNDIGDKVFGPVDLIELERKRLAKSDKKMEVKRGAPSMTDDKKLLKTTQNMDALTKPDAPTDLKNSDKQKEEDEQNILSENSLSPSGKFRSCFKNTKAYDDRFRASGRLKVGTTIYYWRQDERKTKNGDRRIDVIKYRNKQCSNLSYNASYLDDDGDFHLKYNNRPKKFVSGSYHSYSHKHIFLLRAKRLLTHEDANIRRSGFAQLKGIYRGKHKKFITTEGALLLGAVVKSIGVKNIAHQKTSLGAVAFNNIQGLLKMEKTDWVVHRMVSYVGLNVKKEKNSRRRELMNGTNPDGHQYVCYDCPDPVDVFDGAVPRIPGMEAALVRVLEDNVAPGAVDVPGDIERLGIDAAHDVLLGFFLGDNRLHFQAMARYLGRREALFHNMPDDAALEEFADDLGYLQVAAYARRTGAINGPRYQVALDRARIRIARNVGGFLRIAPGTLMNLLTNRAVAFLDRQDEFEIHVRAEMQRLQLLRRIPSGDIFKISESGNDTDTDEDKAQDRDVRKNAFNLASSLNFVVSPR